MGAGSARPGRVGHVEPETTGNGGQSPACHYGREGATGTSRRDDDAILFSELVPTLAWRKPRSAGVDVS